MLPRSTALAVAAAIAAAGISAQVAAGGAPSVWPYPRGPAGNPPRQDPAAAARALSAAEAKRARRAARNLRRAGVRA